MTTTRSPLPEFIRDLAYGFQKSRIVLTAYELEIFTVLAGSSKTSGEVARQLGTDRRATDRLMNALCGLGLLRKESGRFTNAPIALRYLVRGKPEFISGMMHTVHLWESWSTLTEAVKRGTAVSGRKRSDEGGKKWLSAFIAAMHDRAVRSALEIARGMDLRHVEKALDVGGGSGAYAMGFVRANKRLRATVFDLPDVIPLTRKYVRGAKLSGRIRFMTGDYLHDGLGKGYDLVFLSAVIHSNSARENQKLILKCAEALNPGGRVVVQDFIMDEDRTRPVHGAIFALNMLVGTAEGDTYTESEVAGWMRHAGLTGIGRRETPFGTTQITGWNR